MSAATVERLAIVARLKEGSGRRAAELLAAGPPFDLAETGIVHHDLIGDPFRPKLQRAFDAWRSIVDGSPRAARERFRWEA